MMIDDRPLLEPIFAYISDRNKTCLCTLPIHSTAGCRFAKIQPLVTTAKVRWHLYNKPDVVSHRQLMDYPGCGRRTPSKLRVVGAHPTAVWSMTSTK